MKKVLIISGHTDLKHSVANKTILDELEKKLPQAEIVLLDALYPDFKIDVEKEQQRLLNADIIVFEYPVFWYSWTSLLHRYVEDVFLHGFSHGSTGDKLKGKKLVLSFTTGAPEAAYTKEAMGITLDDLQSPTKATCNLTQMEYAGAIYTCGVSYGNRTDASMIAQQEAVCREHAARLIKFIGTL